MMGGICIGIVVIRIRQTIFRLLIWIIHDIGGADRAVISHVFVASTKLVMIDRRPRVPWIGMGLVIKRDVFRSERLAWIVDVIILIMISPLSGAIGREDDKKVELWSD